MEEKERTETRQETKAGKTTSKSSKKKTAKPDKTAKELEKVKAELQEMKDKYLRMYSEFENFKRRTAKERLDLVSNANEDLIIDILPVLDDFIRAGTSFGDDPKPDALKEGFEIVENKLKRILDQRGLKKMESEQGTDFNTDLHEAISQIPSPSKELKGKIVDTVEDGYTLNDKVIRYAKVVIGN